MESGCPFGNPVRFKEPIVQLKVVPVAGTKGKVTAACVVTVWSSFKFWIALDVFWTMCNGSYHGDGVITISQWPVLIPICFHLGCVSLLNTEAGIVTILAWKKKSTQEESVIFDSWESGGLELMTNHHNLWCADGLCWKMRNWPFKKKRCVIVEFPFHDKCITSFVCKASANGWKLILVCFSAQYT